MPATDEFEPIPESNALRAENAALRRTLADVTAERDELAQLNGEQFVLRQVFSALNSSLDLDVVLAMVLRGVREALHFERVVLFDVAGGRALRRLETDAQGDVVPAGDPEGYRRTASFDAVAGGTSDFVLGDAASGEGPLPDAAGAFCLLPLLARGANRGVLYAEAPPGAEITERQLRTLLDFASHAAVAIENARLLQETHRLALTDSLTGLANRRALDELLERELANAHRYRTPLAFVLLDLDDLKLINDRTGHAAGDDALRRVAATLSAGARRGDIIARYGGDEFVVVMREADAEAAERAVRRLASQLRHAGLRCSIGIARFPDDGSDAGELLTGADRALYTAKQLGKDRYAFAVSVPRNPPPRV